MIIKPRILVVEDDSLWIANYRAALKNLDADVQEAQKVSHALAALRKQAYALTIIDLEMKGNKEDTYGGFEVLDVAKQLNPYTQLVVITCHDEPEVVDRVSRLKVTVVKKPINWRELSLLASTCINAWQNYFNSLIAVIESFSTCLSLLTNRKHTRPDFKVAKEYDLQDLLHVILKPFYPDIEPEEYSLKRAGSQKRPDFVIKGLETVIETKIIRDLKHSKSIADELDIDIRNYVSHPHCSYLFCFVYDPKRLIRDPRRIEEDLSGENTHKGKVIDVQVLIRS